MLLLRPQVSKNVPLLRPFCKHCHEDVEVRVSHPPPCSPLAFLDPEEQQETTASHHSTGSNEGTTMNKFCTAPQ